MSDENLIELRNAELESARLVAFHEWWSAEAQSELRKSCACGWAYYIWNAALDNAVVELPRQSAADDLMFISDARSRIERAGLRVKS